MNIFKACEYYGAALCVLYSSFFKKEVFGKEAEFT